MTANPVREVLLRSNMTRVLKDLGLLKRAVDVIVQEIPKAHWGVAGIPAFKSMRDEKPP